MFELAVFLFLLTLGWLAGWASENRHLRNLENRESQNAGFLITQLKSYPALAPAGPPPELVVGEVVIATDYLKSFLANLRRLFGGEVRSYHSLLARARREATQKCVEHARALGHNAICNLRIENADVGGNTAAKKGAVMVAILATATAYTYQGPHGPTA